MHVPISVPRVRTILLALAAATGLAGCAYDDGYGYGGLSVGYGAGYYDPWYYDSYYPRRYYGWYDGFYYPGTGYYVFDRGGHRHRWSDGHRRYWEGRRHAWRGDGREPNPNWREFRRNARPEDRAMNPGRGMDRPAWRPREAVRTPQRGERAERAERAERGEGRTVSPRATAPDRRGFNRDNRMRRPD